MTASSGWAEIGDDRHGANRLCQLSDLSMSARDERVYYTYIVASRSHTLYIGMTGNLHLRIFQHKQKTFEGFSADYNCNRLVWFERFMSPGAAIAREKQLKGWLRAKKIALIEKMNPAWADLSDGWYVVDPSKMEQTAKATAGPSTTAAGATFAQDDKGL
jgi:putative endonuclease